MNGEQTGKRMMSAEGCKSSSAPARVLGRSCIDGYRRIEVSGTLGRVTNMPT
jgi:hypothetical protein